MTIDLRGSNLSRRVTDHSFGVHSKALQQFDKGQLYSRRQRLRIFGLINVFATAQFIWERVTNVN